MYDQIKFVKIYWLVHFLSCMFSNKVSMKPRNSSIVPSKKHNFIFVDVLYHNNKIIAASKNSQKHFYFASFPIFFCKIRVHSQTPFSSLFFWFLWFIHIYGIALFVLHFCFIILISFCLLLSYFGGFYIILLKKKLAISRLEALA